MNKVPFSSYLDFSKLEMFSIHFSSALLFMVCVVVSVRERMYILLRSDSIEKADIMVAEIIIRLENTTNPLKSTFQQAFVRMDI